MRISLDSNAAAMSSSVVLPKQLPVMPLPDAVLDPVFELLTRLSVRRHGATALLRALSRAERAPGNVSAF